MSLSGFWLRGVSCALNKIYLKRGKDNHRGQTSHLKCPRYNRSEVDLIELCTHVWRSSLSVSVFFFFSLREAEPTRFHFKTTRTHGGSNVSSPFSLTNEWATARSAVTGLMRPVFTPPRPESNAVKAAETHCLLILQLCEVFSKGSWIFPFHFFFFFLSCPSVQQLTSRSPVCRWLHFRKPDWKLSGSWCNPISASLERQVGKK